MRRIQINKGDRFTRLEVIEELEPKRKPSGQLYRVIRCRCDCGKEIETKLGNLRSGQTTSCGCLGFENRVKARTSHGMSGTTKEAYGSWKSIIQRCCNKNNHQYAKYGGRGIKVCERWMKFENFLEDMGERPSPDVTMDRIDVNGDYEPGNCRWATWKTQQRNRRNNRMIEYKGEKMTMADAADLAGLPYFTVRSRIDLYGWSVEKALETPKIAQKDRRKRMSKKVLTP